jgi:hypothetical protein
MSGDLDLHGKHAEHFAANSSPVVMPYAWQFADGEEIWVRPGQDSVRPGSR